MKVLLDSCVWQPALALLLAEGIDAKSVASLPADPGDKQVLAMALQEGRVLITLDKDFGELAVVHGLEHCGIVRLVDNSGPAQAAAIEDVVARFAIELASGAIVTYETERVRVRLDQTESP